MKTIFNYFQSFKRIKEFQQEIIKLNSIIDQKNLFIEQAAIIISAYEKENEELKLELTKNKL